MATIRELFHPIGMTNTVPSQQPRFAPIVRVAGLQGPIGYVATASVDLQSW
jgi:hypothetical protein